MQNRIRTTSGVRFSNRPQTPPAIFKQIESYAHQAFHLGAQYSKDWSGARPTLPECLPVIGETKHKGLWLNTGHQHIGLSTAPACAQLLSDMLVGKKSSSTSPFSPSRFYL